MKKDNHIYIYIYVYRYMYPYMHTSTDRHHSTLSLHRVSTCLRPSRHRALTSDLLMDVLQFCCANFVELLNCFCVCLTDWLVFARNLLMLLFSVLLCWGSFFTVLLRYFVCFLRILVSFWYPWGSFGDPGPSQGTPEGANSKKWCKSLFFVGFWSAKAVSVGTHFLIFSFCVRCFFGWFY